MSLEPVVGSRQDPPRSLRIGLDRLPDRGHMVLVCRNQHFLVFLREVRGSGNNLVCRFTFIEFLGPSDGREPYFTWKHGEDVTLSRFYHLNGEEVEELSFEAVR